MQEEGTAVTGHSDPHAAMQSVLSRPRSCTQWCIVKQGGQGAMLLTRDSPEVFDQPALKVWHAARGWLLGAAHHVAAGMRHSASVCMLLRALAANTMFALLLVACLPKRHWRVKRYTMSGLTTKLPLPLQVPVADTVGCGDSFAAAIILGFIRGHSIPETLALANAGEGSSGYQLSGPSTKHPG